MAAPASATRSKRRQAGGAGSTAAAAKRNCTPAAVDRVDVPPAACGHDPSFSDRRIPASCMASPEPEPPILAGYTAAASDACSTGAPKKSPPALRPPLLGTAGDAPPAASSPGYTAAGGACSTAPAKNRSALSTLDELAGSSKYRVTRAADPASTSRASVSESWIEDKMARQRSDHNSYSCGRFRRSYSSAMPGRASMSLSWAEDKAARMRVGSSVNQPFFSSRNVSPIPSVASIYFVFAKIWTPMPFLARQHQCPPSSMRGSCYSASTRTSEGFQQAGCINICIAFLSRCTGYFLME